MKPIYQGFLKPFATCFAIGFLLLLTFEATADLIIFHNGDFRYGAVKKVGKSYTLTVNGITRVYKSTQVKDVAFGVNEPAVGDPPVSVTDFVHSATTSIWSITGAVTKRSTLYGEEDREVILDVEDGYEITNILISSANYTFYNHRGTYLTANIVNETTQTHQGLEFRLYFYAAQDRLMSTKDIYLRSLPGNPPNRKAGRRFSIAMPDIPYERIERLRVVRKF